MADDLLITTPMHDVPVVLITYNRPWHTAQVVDALKKHNIHDLFIFSDAPKTADDVKTVAATRALVEEIDWTDPVIVYQKNNIGLARSVVNAVNYVFEKHDKLILLEDDCVPQQYFFDFMHECLYRYENNEKIFGISGYAVPISENILARYPYDNFFFPRICSWGWATWKRAWGCHGHEPDLKKLFDMTVERRIDLNQGGSDIPDYIESMLRGDLKDVWTLAWQLTVYLYGGCYVHPTRTHVSNIGMDGSGVHRDMTAKYVSTAALRRPVKFADNIFCDPRIVRTMRSFYDIQESGNRFQFLLNKIRNFIRNFAV